MKKTFIPIVILSTTCTHAATTLSFEFDTSANAINGNTTLADAHDTAIDGKTTATSFSLNDIVPGLTLTITPSQNDISYTTTGLGIDTGGTLDAVGDALTFSFNREVSLDFLDMGSFTGSGGVGEDSVSVSFSNSNPTINLVGGDFENNTSDTINFSSGNTLAANESFTISRVDGSFTIQGFDVTAVPEPSSVTLIGLGGLALLMRRRK
ncbi:MAG: PEP-CTERM sorting domain-containing protein [Verrucomicrobiae bacterium]|nr:PEP-CTERM sorting domain-containing protein [Verrucomicrobiae bacterium]NNJ86156.1 PEP-CTERM sorting domain-containing protein [Akkermansiaceae bacterium]